MNYNNSNYDNNGNSYNPNVYNNLPYPEDNNGKKGMAIASMVLGIIALVSCICFCSAIPLGIVSIILAIIVIVKRKNGKGFAITGIITSGLAIITSIIVIILYMPLQEKIQDLYVNAEYYCEQYEEYGIIPDCVLEICDGDEKAAESFMQGFSQSYNAY